MNRNLMEFIGTFFLVFTVGMVSIEPGVGVLAPVAIGTVLAVMVYAGGPISGGHYNPAVSLGVWLRGKLEPAQAVGYWVSQLLAAGAAALVARYLKGAAPSAAAGAQALPVLVAEFIFTFALVFVVLSVATSPRSEGNSYFGFAIGFTVMVGAVAVGPVSGGVFNPAVAAGAVLMGLLPAGSIWLYLVATLLAAAAAAAAFRAVVPEA